MQRKHWLMLASATGTIVILASVFAGLKGARGVATPVPIITTSRDEGGTELEVASRSPVPGALFFSAKAKHTRPFDDGTVWFNVEVRKIRKDGYDVPWKQEFNSPLHWVKAKKGKEVKPVLVERQVPMVLPPGLYAVLIELRDDTTHVDMDGNESPGGIAGQTTKPVTVH